MTKKCYSLVAVLTAFCLAAGARAQTDNPSAAASSQPQVTQPQEGGVNWKGVGIGAGTVASNLVYVPAKLVYGILGGIAGGAGYALTGGNKDVAESIWRSSLGGDYVLTPDKITGDQPIYFSGPSTTGPAATTTPAGSAAISSSNLVQTTPNAAGVSSGGGTNGSVSATQPIDSGAGPIGATTIAPASGPAAYGVNSAGNSNSHPGMVRTMKAPPLPDTSIE